MPAWSLPSTLTDLLVRFRSCFTAPTFATFVWLVTGFLAQPGARTITGMLVGARRARSWRHARAHRLFSAARWSADQLGLCLLEVIVATLVSQGAPRCAWWSMTACGAGRAARSSAQAGITTPPP